MVYLPIFLFLGSCTSSIQIGLNTEFLLIKNEKTQTNAQNSSLFKTKLTEDCYYSKSVLNTKSKKLIIFSFCSNGINEEKLKLECSSFPYLMINSKDSITIFKRTNNQNIEYIFREPGFPHYLIVNVSSEFINSDLEFLNSRLKAKYLVEK